MTKTKFQTKAAKAIKSWQLLQEEKKVLEEKKEKEREFREKTIELKVAHKRTNSKNSHADSA